MNVFSDASSHYVTAGFLLILCATGSRTGGSWLPSYQMNETRTLEAGKRARTSAIGSCALPKPRCMGMRNIPITPSPFCNIGRSNRERILGKTGRKTFIGLIAADAFAIRVRYWESLAGIEAVRSEMCQARY